MPIRLALQAAFHPLPPGVVDESGDLLKELTEAGEPVLSAIDALFERQIFFGMDGRNLFNMCQPGAMAIQPLLSVSLGLSMIEATIERATSPVIIRFSPDEEGFAFLLNDMGEIVVYNLGMRVAIIWPEREFASSVRMFSREALSHVANSYPDISRDMHFRQWRNSGVLPTEFLPMFSCSSVLGAIDSGNLTDIRGAYF